MVTRLLGLIAHPPTHAHIQHPQHPHTTTMASSPYAFPGRAFTNRTTSIPKSRRLALSDDGDDDDTDLSHMVTVRGLTIADMRSFTALFFDDSPFNFGTCHLCPGVMQIKTSKGTKPLRRGAHPYEMVNGGIDSKTLRRMRAMYESRVFPRFLFLDWDLTLTTWHGLEMPFPQDRDGKRALVHSVFGGESRTLDVIRLLNTLMTRQSEVALQWYILTAQSDRSFIKSFLEMLKRLTKDDPFPLLAIPTIFGKDERNHVNKCDFIKTVMKGRCDSV